MHLQLHKINLDDIGISHPTVAMVVRIRLARMFGRAGWPKYNITVAYGPNRVTRKPIEVIGTYDPVPKQFDDEAKGIKEVHLDFDRARYWLGVGAQPSDTVTRLFEKFGILPPKPRRESPQSKAGKDETSADK
ncbi:ribosomal protein S16 domain-containing protein [Lipomyces japonicus]|uniref:ribosomal protein S16 domain-containing protein n=1 Tax=Lipomyces japonicus TaxID=56871 RepID=UPI0034CEC06F